MPVRNMKYTPTKPSGGAVEEVYIEDLPDGGDSAPGDNSITTSMLQAGAVTNDKIAEGTIQASKLASGVIPTIPGSATTETLGLVKQAAHVDGSDGTAIVAALVAAGLMASA